jgi:large subunit ribosomal protein L17
MRHGKTRSRLGVKADHRVAMLRNLSLGLVQHGRIKTTLPRAKKLRPFLEPIVTRLKDPTVANLRLAVATLNNRDAVMEIANKIAPKMKDRPGGYLRILKLSGYRAGDAADMALIEWVEESLVNAYNADAAPKNKGKKGKKPAKGGKKAAAASGDKEEKTEKKAAAPKKKAK